MEYVQQRLHAVLNRNKILRKIIQDLEQKGARAYLVGGAVRDLVAGLPLLDYDIEVHNMSLTDLSDTLGAYAPVSYVGKVYGVLKLHDPTCGHIDWSIPRHDTAGRKPDVELDPYMGIERALLRRDLTMNAMALNMHTGELVDPFHGYNDIMHRVLRAPDPDFFVEDPLRFYRVMQFIARYDMWPDDTLNQVCAQMDISQVSLERIDGEMEKLLIKSRRPSRAVYWLRDIGRLGEVAPEVDQLRGVPQSPLYHPEGDVFTHTMQVIDAAAYAVLPDYEDRLVLMYAALCHDLGKPARTETDASGAISSHGHEDAGIEPARHLLQRFTRRNRIHRIVPRMVAHHMAPGVYGRNDAKISKYKLLAAELAPDVSLYFLSILCYADHRGRNGFTSEPLARDIPDIDTFMQRAQEAGVLYGPEERVLTGDDVLDIVDQGPHVGTLLRKAYDIQLREHIHDKETLKQRARAWLKQEEE